MVEMRRMESLPKHFSRNFDPEHKLSVMEWYSVNIFTEKTKPSSKTNYKSKMIFFRNTVFTIDPTAHYYAGVLKSYLENITY